MNLKMFIGTQLGYVTLIFLLMFFSSIKLTVGNNSNIKCIESEKQALLSFKMGLEDTYGILSSWRNDNCCFWRGVECSNLTNHIIKLDLHGSYPEYMSGKIGPSLFELSHLDYLDLSCNDFTGIAILNYIGSLVNLKYLNLSYNDFEGIIPLHLGNLSSLEALDLHGNYMGWSSESLEWLSPLSSLQYLDLSDTNLENASDWIHFINTLPHLETLLLSSCSLPPPIFPSYPQINISTSLSMLDLSMNHLTSTIFPWLYNFNSSLVTLNLGDNYLHGNIPNAFGSMISLSHIRFQHNQFGGASPKSFSNICNLTFLSFSGNKFEGMFSDFLQILPKCALDSLQYLDFSQNILSGPLPESLTFSSLKQLDLSSNELSGKIPRNLGNFSNVEILDFSHNKISGPLPSFSTFQNLKSLDFSYNEFSGNFTLNFGELSNLETMKFSNNNLSGSLPNFFSFQSLKSLDLSSNKFSGNFTVNFGELSNLGTLDFSNNELSGLLPNFSTFQNLSFLDLSSNEFSGKIPVSLGHLSNLGTLFLANNLLEGIVFEPHFSKLENLEVLDLSHNPLNFHMHSNWVPPFQLRTIILGSCKLGPKFPQWLQGQNFSYLDLSNNSISDTVPYWFWSYFTSSHPSLDLSYNQIKGEIPTILNGFGITSLPVWWNLSRLPPFLEIEVNLRSNEFEGQIPKFLLQVRWLDVSNNKFSGLTNLCNISIFSPLRLLDASNNLFSGEFPNCKQRLNRSSLEFLRLANNGFSGQIPSFLSNLSKLRSLQLRNNSFSGEFPPWLKNFNNLLALDLGDNQLVGAIPSWIGYKLTKLLRLSLRSNQFDGELPSSLCHLNHILFLDISLNNILGEIPNCLHNLTALVMHDNNSQGDVYTGSTGAYERLPYAKQVIYDEMTVTWKGRELIMKETMSFLKSIDLSGNHLTGKIPNEITKLVELVALNLSRNSLTDGIPENIGKLISLDSLDLSRNELTGQIPSSISQISRLSVLDLSWNRLSGKIPIGTQLQSFNASSYVGNPNLCGSPLSSCLEEEMVPNSSNTKNAVADHENEFQTRGFYISLAAGFIVGFWGFWGTLMFHRSWRHAYFRFLNRSNDWLYVKIAIFRNKVRKLVGC